MSAKETLVMNLFDSYWFENGVFTPNPSHKPIAVPQKPEMNQIKTGMRKCHSHQLLTSISSLDDSKKKTSPKSVLPQLQTILSGKEIETSPADNIKKSNIIKIRKSRRSSKSLSDLEFEELKGFMDLGFVFPEDEEKVDNYSRLVAIIPGLQKRVQGNNDEESAISRPYLSEAWDENEIKISRNPLMVVDWRIPAFGNELELKDHLRFWAHTVASTVR